MYKEYFGLTDMPFTLAPDPRYLFMSERHREALAHLIFGINNSGGFVLLTGEVGTGKTTVCRCLLEQIPENTNIAFMLNPKLTVEELLATVCDELGIAVADGNRSTKVFVDRINAYLLDAHAKGRQTVLIIEEAQNLNPDVLEQIRLLTNLETNEQKLLRIVMIGQPELSDLLSKPELRQLSQRITARYHLDSLSRNEAAAYVAHRLSVAGSERQLFPSSTIRRLYRLTGGIPRLMNLVCDRALLGAYAQGKDHVDGPTLAKAADEVFGESREKGRYPARNAVAAFGVMLLVFAAFAAFYYHSGRQAASNDAPVTDQRESVAEAVLEVQQPADLSWPEDLPRSKSSEMAFQELFKLWEASYAPGEVPLCKQAEALGLGCLEKRDSLEALRRLNRPAVLTLDDGGGRDYYAVLTGMSGDRATFLVGGERRVVSRAAVAERWSGDYSMLWRKPLHFRRNIRPGDRGPVVQWLRAQLARRGNRAMQTGEDDLYDASLVREMKRFQVEEGLVPDGIVGAQTVMHLNTTLGVNGPRLISREGEP